MEVELETGGRGEVQVGELDPRVRGGLARAQSLTPDERRDIARSAAVARWSSNMPIATHEGVLSLGGIEIPCSVLEDGTRVLSQTGFVRAIGRKGGFRGGRQFESELGLPEFLAASNLKPFITNDLIANSEPIPFRTFRGKRQGGRAYGFRADLLPLVCNAFLDAKDASALHKAQLHIAQQCKILSRAFAVVGVTALIDEATGYQEVRDRLALQKILEAYLSRELAAWAKRFPNEFYQEMFRLRGWTWDEVRQKQGKGAGPRVVGKYTNDFVYARLAPGILDELQNRNPADEHGRRRVKHHQWLTEDVGHPALAQHLHAVIGLMRASASWEEFQRLINRAFPRRTDLRDLPLFSQALPSAS
jgi:hypothetical protein